MEEKRKLELTLCNLLPYGLKNELGKITGFNINPRYGIDVNFEYDEVVNNVRYSTVPIERHKLLLHSLENITQQQYNEILEIETEYFEEGKVFWQTFNPYGTVDHSFWISSIESEEGEGFLFEHYEIDGTQSIDVLNYKKFEKLKKLHFNVYNLSPESYIEKDNKLI